MNHPEAPSCGSFAFAENMLDAAATYSLRHRRFCYLNAVAEKILGTDAAAILADAASAYRRVMAEDRPAVDAFLRQIETRGVASGEFRIRRADGEARWLSVRAFPVCGSDGEPLCAAIAEDITERKLAEQALRDSEFRLRLVAENIDEVFWLLAPDAMQVLYVSPGYEKIWGLPVADIYASPLKWVQAVHPEDQARVIEAATHLQSEGPREMQFRIMRADGQVGFIRHRSTPIRDAAGAVVQVACMSEDVTAQKRLEKQAEESVRAQRDALVREVHHRIKNNLQGVTGMLRNYANRHAEVAEVISEAIAQVQAVAIIYGLQGRPGIVRVELFDLLREVVLGVSQLMHGALAFQEDSRALGYKVVVSDLEAVPIALVLNEMVFNALKHGTPETTPMIDVKVDIANERVILSITNAGHLPPSGPGQAADRGSGLQLIRSLLPRRGACFGLTDGPAGVEARLTLEPPIITFKC